MTLRALALARHSRASGNPVLAFCSAETESESFHSSCGRAGNCSLLVQRKVTKRNTPQSVAPDAHPAHRVRVSGRVRLSARPCAGSRMSAIHRAPPAGVSGRCRRNAMGTRKSQGSALLRAEATARAKALHAVAFDLALDLRVPVCRGEGRSEMLAESRARCARVRCTHTDVRSTNPGLSSRTATGGAASGAHSLWFLSLVRARERNPRAGRARKGEETRSQKIKSQARSSWIPACAGMTSKGETSESKADARRVSCT